MNIKNHFEKVSRTGLWVSLLLRWNKRLSCMQCVCVCVRGVVCDGCGVREREGGGGERECVCVVLRRV